jgi:hypothetical protein
MTTPVTPVGAVNSFVVTGGTSVIAIPANPNGGFIVNPLTAADQGISPVEPLYIDPVGSAGVLHANGTIFALQPGQSWPVIPGQTTPTYVNATTSGHKFSGVSW